MCYTFLAISLVLVFLKIYAKVTTGRCKSKASLTGKTVIITGANQGIGYETALDIAKRGARVILACRNKEKAEEACKKIIEKSGNRNVVVKLLDLCSFTSVRDFARNIITTENRLDILINNAGIVELDGNKKTIDGHVLIRQVNFFASFLLTNLLLDFMKNFVNGRIVNVSSLAALTAFNFKPNKLDSNRGSIDEYNYTKLCNILFTQELARRLKDTNITTYSVHPGFVNTTFFQNIPQPFTPMINLLLSLYSKTAEEGAQTTIFCAVEEDIEKYSGEHFSDCCRVKAFWNARNPKLARDVWEKTEQIVESKTIKE